MEHSDDILLKIRDFTARAHGKQMRKYSDEPYIVHPVRVMEICRNYNDALPVLAAALLHDVLEDTPVSREELHQFLRSAMTGHDAAATLALVIELTDVYVKKDYPRMNRRARKEREAERLSKVSPEGQTIKYADILDNTDVTTGDPDFAKTFLRECKNLLSRMEHGNPDLRERVMKRVSECLQYLKNRKSGVERPPHMSIRQKD